MNQVENAVEKVTGLTLDLLPDWLSRDSYEAGLTVAEGVAACLEQTGFAAFENEMLVDDL